MDADERETVTDIILSALGNESRLRIYKLLVRAAFGGLNVGDIQERLKIPASMLSHHIEQFDCEFFLKNFRIPIIIPEIYECRNSICSTMIIPGPR